MKRALRALLPESLIARYHFLLAHLGALAYRNPSHRLFVIAITGTKGKSTTAELVRSVLAGAGHTVALASTIRFAVGERSEPNLFKMTMPGRFFLQKFLRQALNAGATHAVIEMTSEGAKQFRHAGIELDALVFTNLQREHLESHGGFENYLKAKLSLARALERSPKRPRIIVANADDPHGKDFLAAAVEVKAPFSLKDAEPYRADEHSARFVWRRGALIDVPLPGLFNLENALAAVALGDALGVPVAVMQKALARVRGVPGRAERVEAGQPFTVVVDYAHTPDSLRALFAAFKPQGEHKLICVIGSTGGGRDTWKRPEMGAIADSYCDTVFLTDEDPYDEDPRAIVNAVAKGFMRGSPRIVMDRREAIAAALAEAKAGDAVLITGKGTDPFIMRAKGAKEPWSDRRVVQEELQKLGYH